MNRTIISIEVQAHNGKEATIIVKGEQNNQIMFEKQFEYKDEEKHSMQYLPPNRKRFCMRKESGTLPIRINKHHIQNTIAAIRFHFYIYVSS